MPRLRRANVKACWMFSLGSLEKLALRSTKAGFMDLIRARNARPLLQLFPKSSTSTPNLRSIGSHASFNLTCFLDSGSFPHSLRRASLDPLQQSVDGVPVMPRVPGGLSALAWQGGSTGFTGPCREVRGAQRGAGGGILKASDLLHLYQSTTERTELRCCRPGVMHDGSSLPGNEG